MVKDTDAVRAQLLQWASDATLRRVIVSHGDVIDRQPRQALRLLAASLK
jgi:hypothetical protein